jgi:DNA polymerase-3 subunit delta'
MPPPINLPPELSALVSRFNFEHYIARKQLPSAMLLVGLSSSQAIQLAKFLIGNIFCEANGCGSCAHCHLLFEDIHPDVKLLTPVKAEKVIKIDAVRDLIQTIYQTPKKAKQQFVLISPANKMNTAAANALLKVLEEPPIHTSFILMAEQEYTLPITIRSRCQRFLVNAIAWENYWQWLSMSQEIVSPELIVELPLLVEDLCLLVKKGKSPCKVAARWGDYNPQEILTVFYTLCAQALRWRLCERQSDAYAIPELFNALSPLQWFNQLDRIKELTKKIHHNIQINFILSFETLLLGFL